MSNERKGMFADIERSADEKFGATWQVVENASRVELPEGMEVPPGLPEATEITHSFFEFMRDYFEVTPEDEMTVRQAMIMKLTALNLVLTLFNNDPGRAEASLKAFATAKIATNLVAAELKRRSAERERGLDSVN